jgi:hypothetical protein
MISINYTQTNKKLRIKGENMDRLSNTIQLLYSDLIQQRLHGLPLEKGISFVKKTIKYKDYWYLQVSIGKQKTQYSIGPDFIELRKLIQKEKDLKIIEKENIKNNKELVSMLKQTGVVSPTGEEGTVLSLLERSGVFLTGGTLIGSHAFGIYSNMLGVRWRSNLYRTDDVDICSDNNIQIGIKPKRINLKEEIINSNLGFFEIPALNRKHPSTSFKIRNKSLKIDLLTPMKGKPSSQPIYISSLKTYAEPLRYLDYLLKNIQPAVIIQGKGILVNVPDPAHFALHKLVISCLRIAAFQTKAIKDISQASQLLEVLLEDRPGDISLAVNDVKKMPRKFQKLLIQGFEKLPQYLKENLYEYGINSSSELSPH